MHSFFTCLVVSVSSSDIATGQYFGGADFGGKIYKIDPETGKRELRLELPF